MGKGEKKSMPLKGYLFVEIYYPARDYNLYEVRFAGGWLIFLQIDNFYEVIKKVNLSFISAMLLSGLLIRNLINYTS